jgi:hypothetical protein
MEDCKAVRLVHAAREAEGTDLMRHEDDAAVALYTKLGVREDVLHLDIQATDGEA